MHPTPEFASEAWVAALDAASTAVDLGDDGAAAEGIVLQQVVTGDGGATWTVAVEDGRVRFRPGRAERADVTLSADRSTAESVHRGEVSAHAVFMAGRLQIDGDPTALLRLQPALARLDAAREG